MFLALDETLLSVVPMCVLAPTRSWSAVEGTLRVLGVPNLFLPEGPWAQEAGGKATLAVATLGRPHWLWEGHIGCGQATLWPGHNGCGQATLRPGRTVAKPRCVCGQETILCVAKTQYSWNTGVCKENPAENHEFGREAAFLPLE